MPASPAELFERHHLAIYRYLLRMTGSRDQAEELTQDVFLRVIKSQGSYTEQDRERAWLFQIARNLRCDRLRHDRRRIPPLQLDNYEPAEAPRQALRLNLLQALANLSDEDREAFVLAEIGGLSYAEIGLVCVITPAAVRSRIYRARLALRAALAASVIDETRLVRGNHA